MCIFCPRLSTSSPGALTSQCHGVAILRRREIVNAAGFVQRQQPTLTVSSCMTRPIPPITCPCGLTIIIPPGSPLPCGCGRVMLDATPWYTRTLTISARPLDPVPPTVRQLRRRRRLVHLIDI